MAYLTKTKIVKKMSFLTMTSMIVLSACQTTPRLSAADYLLKEIPSDRYGLHTSTVMHQAGDDICQKFYKNAADFVEKPASNTKQKIIETVLLTALAGGATYGVGAIGISNVFASLSLASATNQIVYSTGQTVLNNEKGSSGDLQPAVEIADASMRLGCPAPTLAVFRALKNNDKEFHEIDVQKTDDIFKHASLSSYEELRVLNGSMRIESTDLSKVKAPAEAAGLVTDSQVLEDVIPSIESEDYANVQTDIESQDYTVIEAETHNLIADAIQVSPNDWRGEIETELVTRHEERQNNLYKPAKAGVRVVLTTELSCEADISGNICLPLRGLND